MVQQLHLRVELRHALHRRQFGDPTLESRPGCVHVGENCRDTVDDSRSLSGVVDPQVADDLDQHFEFAGRRGDIFLDLLGVAHLFQAGDTLADRLDSLFVRRQRIFSQEELDAPLGQARGVLGNLGVEPPDQFFIHIAEFAQGNHIAADRPQIGQRGHEITDTVKSFSARGLDNLVGPLLCISRLPGRVAPDADHLVELVDGCHGGRADLDQNSLQLERLGSVEPEVGVDQVARGLDQVDVQVGVGVLLVDQAQHLVTFRHRTDHVLVADFEEIRIAVGVGHVVLAHVGRLPNLHGVVFLRLALALEADQFAALEKRVSVADQGCAHPLPDQVVFEQIVDSVGPVVEHVKIVFAVGRGDPPLEEHVVQVDFERLVFARLQVVAVGENQPVVVGQ